jgi:hypothetical protein
MIMARKLRSDITKLVNELSMQYEGYGKLDIRLFDLYDAIFNYLKQNQLRVKDIKPITCIENGCLMIGGKMIKRVAPLPPQRFYAMDEYSYYLAGKAIAMGEVFD